MKLSNQEMETVLRCVDKVFDFSAERDRLRDLLATLEAENKALRDRVAELEARCKRLEEAVESLLPYAEATDDESSEWGPGRWKSEKLKRIIDEARKAKEAKP